MLATLPVAASAADSSADAIAALIEPLPAERPAAAQPILEKLLAGGPPTITRLVEMVGPRFGDPRGVKPKYALHGLVHHACRPGAEAQRRMVAESLAREISAGRSDDLNAFLCRQLQFCGRDEQVPTLARLLTDDTLCEPATQALTAIGTPKAVAALREALPTADGRQRVTLVNALGALGDAASAAEVRRDLTAADADRRMVAWFALGNMADAAASGALLEATQTGSPYERTQAVDACLRLATTLGRTGKTAEAEKVCRALLAKPSLGTPERCAALATLARVLGVQASGDVLHALDAKEAHLRHPAAWTALDLAEAIQQDHPAEAEKLLRKVLAASTEARVRQKAEERLGKLETPNR